MRPLLLFLSQAPVCFGLCFHLPRKKTKIKQKRAQARKTTVLLHCYKQLFCLLLLLYLSVISLTKLCLVVFFAMVCFWVFDCVIRRYFHCFYNKENVVVGVRKKKSWRRYYMALRSLRCSTALFLCFFNTLPVK